MKTRDGEKMFTCLDPHGNTSIVIEHDLQSIQVSPEDHDQGESGSGDTGE